MKLIFTAGLFAIVLLCTQNASGQATEELLHSKTVKNFLVLKVDAGNKTLGYYIDTDTETRNLKQIRGKTCFAVAEKADEKQVRLELAYLNPFKYKIIITDSSLTDPSFTNVSKFLEQVQGITGQLMTGGASGGLVLPTPKMSTASAEAIKVEKAKINEAEKGKKSAGKDYLKDTARISQEATKKANANLPFENKRVALLDRISAPSLVNWIYQVQLAPAREQWLASTGSDSVRAEAVLTKLGNSTRLYYQPDTAKVHFIKSVKAALDEISSANTFEALQKGHINYKAAVTRLKNFNTRTAATLTEFMDEQKRDLPGEGQREDRALQAVANFSRRAFAEYEAQTTAIQTNREQVVEALTKLDGELDRIEMEMSGGRTSYLLSTLFLTEEKMTDVDIIVQPRTIAYTPENGITVTEGKAIVNKQLRLRASKKIIPEFSTGIFYTNMKYVRYGTKMVGADMVIESATPTKVKGVVAAHLNLVLNTWDGLIHPMLQVGVGTGKDAPCILAGGGLRFTQPKRLALTGGVIWNWQRDLNELKVGDKIDGTAKLESDLQLQLKSTPSLYLGIQYDF